MQAYFSKAFEWKVEEIVNDYEEKLLIDVLKPFNDGYKNSRQS